MSQPHRKTTRLVRVGHVSIGHGSPVCVQSMTNTKTHEVKPTLAQIKRLVRVGCELVRVAVPDQAAVRALPAIITSSPVPIVADIHFDYKLALGAIDAGVAKLRINPGNMGLEQSLQVAKQAAQTGVAVRIGVNSGSVPEKARQKAKTPKALGHLMAKTALQYAAACEKVGLRKIVLSVKASDIQTSLAAYRLLASLADYPLHLGITEAGGVWEGSIKTAVGLSPLLLAGIGDTLRVSLTGDPVKEIPVANLILNATGVRQRGPQIIACPTCGRTVANLEKVLRQVENALRLESKKITVAVMGCVVNGPGEARHADVGIAGAPDGSFMLFAQGRPVRRVTEAEAVSALLCEIKQIPEDKTHA